MNLNKFCGSEEAIWFLSKPWFWGGWTWATNGRICVRVPGLISGAVQPWSRNGEISAGWSSNRLPPAAWKLEGWRYLDRRVPSGRIRKIQVEKVVEEVVEEFGSRVCCDSCAPMGMGRCLCPECNGAGEVVYRNGYHEYEWECKSCDGDGKQGWHRTDQCPACHGTGLDTHSVDGSAVVWRVPSGAIINLMYLRLLVMEMGDLEVFCGPIDNSATAFRNEAGAQAVVMPMMQGDMYRHLAVNDPLRAKG